MGGNDELLFFGQDCLGDSFDVISVCAAGHAFSRRPAPSRPSGNHANRRRHSRPVHLGLFNNGLRRSDRRRNADGRWRHCLLSENGYIGYGSAATGLVSVSGPCSTWGNYSLFVGNSGSGTLSITNGGYVVSPYVCIACNPGSTGLLKVDSAGLALYNNYLYVGNSGSGMLSITNGGLVISSDACIGCYSGSSGTVTVDGSGSRWTTGPLYVGGGDSSYYYGGGSGTLCGHQRRQRQQLECLYRIRGWFNRCCHRGWRRLELD